MNKICRYTCNRGDRSCCARRRRRGYIRPTWALCHVRYITRRRIILTVLLWVTLSVMRHVRRSKLSNTPPHPAQSLVGFIAAWGSVRDTKDYIQQFICGCLCSGAFKRCGLQDLRDISDGTMMIDFSIQFSGSKVFTYLWTGKWKEVPYKRSPI